MGGAHRGGRRPHRGGRGQRPGRRLRPGDEHVGRGAAAAHRPPPRRAGRVRRPRLPGRRLPQPPTRRRVAGAVEGAQPGSGGPAWREEAPLAEPRGGLALAAVAGRLVAVGGTGAGGVLRRTEVLVPGEEGGWRPGPDLSEPRDHLAALGVGGRVYAIAGRQGSLESNLATVESWDPAGTDGWLPEPRLNDTRGGTSAAVGQPPPVCRRRRGARGHHRLGRVPARRPLGAGGGPPGPPPRPGRHRPQEPAARHRRRPPARPLREHRPRGLRHPLTAPGAGDGRQNRVSAGLGERPHPGRDRVRPPGGWWWGHLCRQRDGRAPAEHVARVRHL